MRSESRLRAAPRLPEPNPGATGPGPKRLPSKALRTPSLHAHSMLTPGYQRQSNTRDGIESDAISRELLRALSPRITNPSLPGPSRITSTLRNAATEDGHHASRITP